MNSTDDFEIHARRRKYAQVAAAQSADAERMEALAEHEAAREAASPEAMNILRHLEEDRDPHAFKDALGAWSKQRAYASFGGVQGQMFVNQVVNAGADEPARIAELLGRVLQPPEDAQDAARKLRALIDYVKEVKKGAHPAPKRALFVASFFWSLAQPDRWPCMWASAENMLSELGWLTGQGDLVQRYLEFRSVVLSLEAPPRDVANALFWFEHHPWVGLAPSLVDRASRAREFSKRWNRLANYESDEQEALAEANVRAMLGELQLLTKSVQEQISVAFGRSVTPAKAPLRWKEGKFRGDAWVAWRTAGGSPGLSLRLWLHAEGLYVGLDPGWYRNGWYDEARAAVAQHTLPSGLQQFDARQWGEVTQTEQGQGQGWFLIGRRFAADEALDRPSFADEVISIADAVRSVADDLLGRAGIARTSTGGDEADGLAALVDGFIKDRGYPAEKDRQARSAREEMAELLRPEELPIIDLADLRSIYASRRYGHPGAQANLSRTLRDASPSELETYMKRLAELLWGDGTVQSRIDRSLDPEDLGIKGLGESVIMKLLSVVYPERFIPAFPYAGDMGKLRLMRLIGLDPPDESLSRGARQVAANDAIRSRLDPYFPGDPWGQAQFFYWLNQQDQTVDTAEGADLFDELAERLLVPREFIDDIVALLRDKGQVILYGPPGTGKTYLARELAKVLAPDARRRALVQFHPSMAYEDFFEGYRPEGDAGELTYRLTPGPLARLAEQAERAPGVDHVMIIDEINRANLPKVFGELLFLLEYRNESVRTAYRPEEGFELPPDLLLIGTMNTADRSIALVDAALRRRFHFIPFFPHEGPMAGLLGRWLESNNEPPWVAELVDMVNAELIDELGGPHLQIGPSHFMRRGLDESAVRRIWTYNISPFIEDQLFGEPARISQYTFDAVLSRFRKEAGVDEDASVAEAFHADGDE